MAISLITNISSLRANTRLNDAQRLLSRSYERLSSGQRINSAADDAAGLAIADQLRALRLVSAVAIRNANDGISLLSIADHAISEISSVFIRMGELAEQAANGVYSVVQRSALDFEFVALSSEVERIALTTQFNGINPLSGASNLVFQVGFTAASTSQITYLTSANQVTLNALQFAGSAGLTYSLNGSTIVEGQNAARTALAAVQRALEELSQKRGSLGAIDSRLSFAVNNLQSQRTNFTAAESRIRDVDVASESADMLRFTVLTQAAAAIAAQANQSVAIVLKLLS